MNLHTVTVGTKDPEHGLPVAVLSYKLDFQDRLRYMICNRCLQVPEEIEYQYVFKDNNWVDPVTNEPAPTSHCIQILAHSSLRAHSWFSSDENYYS